MLRQEIEHKTERFGHANKKWGMQIRSGKCREGMDEKHFPRRFFL